MRSGDILGLPFCLLVFGSIAGGCASPVVEESAAEEIAWAEQTIDGQRVIKRRLLVADPIERAIEAYLGRDPRVASARFALLISRIGDHGGSDDAPFWFEAVVKTHQPVTDTEAAELLIAAFESAGARASLWSTSRIVRDGSTWVASGTLYPTTKDNPDLSELRRESP